MSDNNPRLKNWLDQVEQSKYQSDRHIKASHQVNNSVIQNESDLIFVGFWRRFFAKIIDWVIVAIIPALFLLVFLHPFLTASLNNNANLVTSVETLIWFLTWFFYYTILPATRLKGTIGKLAVGAVIVDKNGKQLRYSHSVGRFFASLLSAGLLLIGYIMVASSPEKRGLHDRMADTYVVNKT